MTSRWPAALAVLALVGCSGSTPPSARSTTTTTPSAQRLAEVVDAELGGVRLRLEVADDEQERATGLMGRPSVPPGTGMLFRFGSPTRDRFYMYRTLVPLVVAFVRDGVVVGTAQMTPCAERDPRACPTYGPGAPYDTAVETAPATLPSVRTGDRLVVTSS